MSEEVSAYEIFIVLPANLDTTNQLTFEEAAELKAAEAFVDKMTIGVRQMYDTAVAKCTEHDWKNLPPKCLYTARIVIASVAPYRQQLIEQVRETSAHLKGSG